MWTGVVCLNHNHAFACMVNLIRQRHVVMVQAHLSLSSLQWSIQKTGTKQPRQILPQKIHSTCTLTHKLTHIHILTHTYTHVHTQTLAHIQTQTHTNTHIHTHPH